MNLFTKQKQTHRLREQTYAQWFLNSKAWKHLMETICYNKDC